MYGFSKFTILVYQKTGVNGVIKDFIVYFL